MEEPEGLVSNSFHLSNVFTRGSVLQSRGLDMSVVARWHHLGLHSGHAFAGCAKLEVSATVGQNFSFLDVDLSLEANFKRQTFRGKFHLGLFL